MPSSFTPSLRLTLQADGEDSNTWGQIANVDFSLIETAISGVLTKDCSAGGTITLTTANGATDEARNIAFILSGTPASAFSVVFPAQNRLITVGNSTSYVATLSVGGGTTYPLFPGRSGIFITTSLGVFIVGDSTKADGQCYLSLASTTTVTFAPQDGYTLVVNSTQAYIPPGGVTGTLSSPAASTVYYIYGVATAGTVSSVEFSTTGYTIDAYGRKNKTGDLTRRFIGFGMTDSSGNLVQVISAFNKRRLNLKVTGGSATASPSYVPLTGSLPFMSAAGENSYIKAVGYSYNSSGYQTSFTEVYVDGTQASTLELQIFCDIATAGYPFVADANKIVTEGSIHNAALYGKTNGATSTWLFELTVNYAG